MNRAILRWLPLVLAFLYPTGFAAGQEADWETIASIFRTRCVMCHSVQAAAKELRLDSYEASLAGGSNGPVLLAGDPARSELARRLRGESTPRMPFLSSPLPPDQIALVERWIAAGLPRRCGDDAPPDCPAAADLARP